MKVDARRLPVETDVLDEPARSALDIGDHVFVGHIGGEVAASVPDLITIVDLATSTPINAERLRYGQRVTVFGIGCPECYRTDAALAVVHPRCFGFDIEYVPVEKLD